MKTRRCFDGLVLFSVIAVTIVFAARTASSQETGQETTRAAMRGLFVTLSNVYGYSLDPVAFADPKNHQKILNLLQALEKNANSLEAHGGELDPSFGFMKRSLVRDAHDALENFQSSNDIGARFILSKITDNCATCHTKLPATREFSLGQEFLDSVDAARLPPIAFASLQVAARQFAEAMNTYEKVLTSPDVSAEDLAMFDVVENYLRVSLGALNDTKRPVKTLTLLSQRADMPDAVKANAKIWIASLNALNLDASKGKELATARDMVAGARAKTKSRSDRSQLVDFVASIALLHRYLQTQPVNDVDAQEAFYLLGVAESYVSHSYWISETDYLLEKSIRIAPKTKVARDALAYLEEYTRSGHDTQAARAVPPELQTNIDELRKLTGQ